MVEISVSETIQARRNDVYHALARHNDYPVWWPLPVRTDLGPEIYFRISPLPYVGIGIEIDPQPQTLEVDYHYVSGPFRGMGKWTIHETGREGFVAVTYAIRLQPQGRFVKWAAGSNAFRNKHARDIKNIIRRLEKWLQTPV